ncbi:SDR family NAD(P)-dependent oxidoreductase [Nocardioides massiliensis]|uniref:NAD(P)-dependent dehydrogenase (Short-subunit alcohol dehydrogenase family) n=1 Tax=Nocardioides massiliensis TaxID=1325935 RepID=A0ABT9NPS7_9ACTN|nr:SDR family NAD(P)-dependent oxidoreductase [Nocardioides massiliensis]MDP9822272.1 NAD(P)-dependent dehydrogenase (short-subunit alcohol dehydrogenase family) [Nocardioides massiliensis]
MTTTPEQSSPTARQVVAGLDLHGRTCAITGATSGLGRASALALAGAGARVLLLGRSTTGLVDTAEQIRSEVADAEVHPVHLDLADLTSVRAAAQEVAALTDRLDVLMNNAGVMFTPLDRTADGFERQLGVNHVGHFALTTALLPTLLTAERPRVVTLSSGGHVLGDVDLGDPHWEHRPYDKFVAYGASKTANVLFTVGLRERYADAGLTAFAVHPGTVATELGRHMSRDDFSELGRLVRERRAGDPTKSPWLEFVNPEQGAATQVWAATRAPDTSEAVYLADCAPSDDVAAYAVDPGRARLLWAASESWCAAALS